MIAYDPHDLLDAGVYTLVPNPAATSSSRAYTIHEKLLDVIRPGGHRGRPRIDRS